MLKIVTFSIGPFVNGRKDFRSILTTGHLSLEDWTSLELGYIGFYSEYVPCFRLWKLNYRLENILPMKARLMEAILCRID